MVLPHLAFRGWKQKGDLAVRPVEPASRTEGKMWLKGTEPWLFSRFSSCQVNQGYNCPGHTKHYLYWLELQLLLLFVKPLWKLPFLLPVHEYVECYSKNPEALKSQRRTPLLVIWLIPSFLICKVEIMFIWWSCCEDEMQFCLKSRWPWTWLIHDHFLSSPSLPPSPPFTRLHFSVKTTTILHPGAVGWLANDTSSGMKQVYSWLFVTSIFSVWVSLRCFIRMIVTYFSLWSDGCPQFYWIE